jgi:hypothetical protein
VDLDHEKTRPAVEADQAVIRVADWMKGASDDPIINATGS